MGKWLGWVRIPAPQLLQVCFGLEKENPLIAKRYITEHTSDSV